MTTLQEREFERAAAHMTRLATTPGWWQYTRAEVQLLEADESGMYRGLRAEVAKRIKEAGYRPPAHELVPMEPHREMPR